jgi:myo-inositol-1(or 4)-monophosphatase
MTDYKIICENVTGIAKKTGAFIRNERNRVSTGDVELKSVSSLVTYVDTTSEKMIVKELKKLIPGCGFITEEGTTSEKSERYNWIIDPLDGTTNYIHKIAPHAVSIALMEDSEMVMGVVYEIGQDEMFCAWKDSPAFLNGKEIKVSDSSKPEDTLIGTGMPYYNFERLDDYIEAMKVLMKSTRGLRRFGSAATDLAYVAAGRFDAFYEHALHAWDVAAGAFIVKQAGGIVTDFNGGDDWLFGGEIIASGSNFFDTFYKIINKYLGKAR